MRDAVRLREPIMSSRLLRSPDARLEAMSIEESMGNVKQDIKSEKVMKFVIKSIVYSYLVLEYP